MKFFEDCVDSMRGKKVDPSTQKNKNKAKMEIEDDVLLNNDLFETQIIKRPTKGDLKIIEEF